MALVLLPCDLPTWPTVQRYLIQLKSAQTAEELLSGMHKLHNLCCIGLESDDDINDPHRFDVFQSFLQTVLSDEERKTFFEKILPSMVECALKLKSLKPVDGLSYSLQQQAEQFSLDRRLAQSLLANAFFSTFPKRTMKTHPTLLDFNFGQFFIHLNTPCQQIKLRCFFQYFETISNQESAECILFSRQVVSDWKSQSLDDWLSSNRPLCPIAVHHDGTIEEAKDEGVYKVCFASPRVGGNVLTDGYNQEELVFSTCPELLTALLYIESLENNESLVIHNWTRVGTVQDGKKIAIGDNTNATDTHLCVIDAIDFTNNPESQYEEKYLLRELSKALSGFQQPKPPRRLSPLGESSTTPPPEMWYSVCGTLEPVVVESEKKKEVAEQNTSLDFTTSATRPTAIGQSFGSISLTESKGLQSPDSVGSRCPIGKLGRYGNKSAERNMMSLTVPDKKPPSVLVSQDSEAEYFVDAPSTLSWKNQASLRGEDDIWFTPMEPNKPFIVSPSLETKDGDEETTKIQSQLELNKKPSLKSIEGILSDEDEDYQSCNEDAEDEAPVTQTVPCPVSSTVRTSLVTPQIRRPIIVRRSSSQSEMNEDDDLSSQAMGTVSRDEDDVHVRRVPSTGFLLDEDDYFVGDGLEAEKEWLRQFRNRSMSRSVSRRNSSRYSFSSDFSSDLEDIYDHFEEMMAKGPVADDPSVAKYVGGLLKRTLSDSLTAARQGLQPCDVMPRSLSLADHLTQERRSLETAKQKAAEATTGGGEAMASVLDSDGKKLSGHLGKQDSRRESVGNNDRYKPIATGNWGCGRLKGDPQLKAAIQWLAASRAQVPNLVYFTQRNGHVVKLDIVNRVLRDRQWTVGILAKAVIKYCNDRVNNRSQPSSTLFDAILARDSH